MSSPTRPSPRHDNVQLQSALQKTTRPTPIPLSHHLLSDVRERMQNSSEAMIERLYVAGEQMLSMCFSHHLFSQPAGHRPVGYYFIMRTAIMCRDTYVLVMSQTDVDTANVPPAVLADALVLFIGALFSTTDFTTVFAWFESAFDLFIAAADGAFIARDAASFDSRVSDNTENDPKRRHVNQGGPRRFVKALGFLTGGKSLLDVSPSPTNEMPDSPRTDPSVVPSEPETEYTGPTDSYIKASVEKGFAAPDVVRKALANVSTLVKREVVSFVGIASEAPAALVEGFMSAFRYDLPRGTKRKRESLVEPPLPSFTAPATVRPRRRVTSSVNFIRARAPSPPSPSAYRDWASSNPRKYALLNLSKYFPTPNIAIPLIPQFSTPAGDEPTEDPQHPHSQRVIPQTPGNPFTPVPHEPLASRDFPSKRYFNPLYHPF
ncbi:hypothetical protein B0H11DRAFT_1975652 [Mycena galericulata]|nr:hypothetical protein B0H11DRAFT_1975652 [Mycena galericulata]